MTNSTPDTLPNPTRSRYMYRKSRRKGVSKMRPVIYISLLFSLLFFAYWGIGSSRNPALSYTVDGNVYHAWKSDYPGEWIAMTSAPNGTTKEAKKAVEAISGCEVVDAMRAPAGSFTLVSVRCYQ